MSKTLRPLPEHFRKAGWHYANSKVYKEWMQERSVKARRAMESRDVTLLPPIQDFKDFIETNPTVYEEFIRMFEGATEPPTNHIELLYMFNDIFREAPYYGDLGPPMYMVMAQNMNTQGGFSAYTKENLNHHFKTLFETWATFLLSADSRYVLVSGPVDKTGKYYGWFSPTAQTALMAEYEQGRTFDEVFICNSKAPFYGYTSYEDFFVRRFRSVGIDRPVVGGVHDMRLIGAPCEAALYNVQYNVQKSDDLFIKDEAYSLVHLLNNDPLMEQFVGGFVIQGFLSTTGYHRWHTPVTGVINKIVDVPGTYFAQAPSTIGDPIPDNDTDLPPYLNSLTYFSNTATRQLIFIDSENPDIGLICFISIGMTEIRLVRRQLSKVSVLSEEMSWGCFISADPRLRWSSVRTPRLQLMKSLRNRELLFTSMN